ncbi:hypothetical protein F5B17DRAFT_444251 [Nemania serpens]|nr:hypothetical protein F5B17DRAFT_444251 [Nemania serpens]
MYSPTIIYRLYLATCLLGFAAPAESPNPQPDDSPDDFHIAIIGAGIAGASAAYHLHRLSACGTNQTQNLKITVYETSPVVGGKVKTIFPPESRHALEAGASYFFEDDWCLSDAAQSLDLERRVVGQSNGAIIWNGYRFLEDRFCFHDAPTTVTPSFWGSVRGMIWQTVQTLITGNLTEVDSTKELGEFRSEMASMQDKLKSLGRNGVFGNLHDEIHKIGLGDTIKGSAEKFLEELAVPDSFQTNVVEPCVTTSFGLDIKQASGLHIVASMGSTRSQPIAIGSGNGKLITSMLDESGARLHIDSQVTKVETGSRRRFSLTIASNNSTKQAREEYDVVVFTGDSMARLHSQGSKPLLKTSPHHITHFSTHLALDPRISGLNLGWEYPTLLTTANSSYLDSETRIMRLTAFPEFYIDASGCSWDDDCDQFVSVHRVDSRTPVSKAKLRLMAMDNENPEYDSFLWFHTQSWNHTLPSNSNNYSDTLAYQTEPEPGMLNANSDLISTLEISCRMGRNAALKLLQTTRLPNGLSQGEVAGFSAIL